MPSSTSRFERRLPLRALGLAAIALVTLAVAAVYTVRWNPEVRFYRHAVEVKRAWAHSLADFRSMPRYLLAGGSSSAFAIDGLRMLQIHGLHVVNFGLHAGLEAPFLIAIAAQEARPGDTLVLTLEPELLTSTFTSPDLAAQLGITLGDPSLVRASDITGARVSWPSLLLSLRPGAYHAFTLLGKIVLHKPLYRYSAGDIHPSGWQEARDFREFPELKPWSPHLSPEGRQLLAALARWSRTAGVRLTYAMPCCYTQSERRAALRRDNARFLSEVSEFMPVLSDPALGVDPVRAHFADTPWHLVAEAARQRTDFLAGQLKTNVFWTREALAAQAAGESRGPTEPDTPRPTVPD